MFEKSRGNIQACHPERSEGSPVWTCDPAGRPRSFAALRMTGSVSLPLPNPVVQVPHRVPTEIPVILCMLMRGGTGTHRFPFSLHLHHSKRFQILHPMFIQVTLERERGKAEIALHRVEAGRVIKTEKHHRRFRQWRLRQHSLHHCRANSYQETRSGGF